MTVTTTTSYVNVYREDGMYLGEYIEYADEKGKVFESEFIDDAIVSENLSGKEIDKLVESLDIYFGGMQRFAQMPEDIYVDNNLEVIVPQPSIN